MTDWIEHDGGPQPVGDDDWLEVLFPGTASGWMARAGNRMAVTWKGQSFKWRFMNQHLIDAARLEGIRLGLEAAQSAVEKLHDYRVTDREIAIEEAVALIFGLNPDTIAKEAKHD